MIVKAGNKTGSIQWLANIFIISLMKKNMLLRMWTKEWDERGTMINSLIQLISNA